jgi:hypothetical protein
MKNGSEVIFILTEGKNTSSLNISQQIEIQKPC